MRAPRRWGPVLTALIWCTLLAGCVSIPSDGPVESGRRVEGGRGRAVYLLPAGPAAGADPGELIRAFVRASAAFTNDHEIARSFLAPGERRPVWRPESPVVIFSGDLQEVYLTRHGETRLDPGPAAALPIPTTPTSPSPSGPSPSGPSPAAPSPSGSSSAAPSPAAPSPSGSSSAAPSPSGASPSGSASASPSADPRESPPVPGETVTVTVTVPVEARIDSNGRYVPSAVGATETRTFQLVGTDQGWRISALEQGILVSQVDFSATFRSMPLYFAEPTGNYLVPDVRWFSVSDNWFSGSDNPTSMPTQLVSALLAGPSEWLRPAVVTGAPAGTQTTVTGVKIVDGVATVDLTTEARAADARQRLMLQAQLENTLAPLSQFGTPVTSVTITVDRQGFELQPAAGTASGLRTPADGVPLDGKAGAQRLRPPPQIDARPVVLDPQGAVARVAGRAVQPVEGLGALTLPGASDPATDGGQAYAVLSGARRNLYYAVPSGQATRLAVGQRLVAPSFDPLGWVWTAQEQSGGELLAVRPDRTVSRVEAAWMSGLRIRSVRIGREGARAVIVAERQGGAPMVLVSGILRDDEGKPTELAPPLRLAADATEVTGAAWVDATHVVILATRPGLTARPWIAEIGGEVKDTEMPIQGTAITAGNDESDLYVQLPGGSVRYRVGSTWLDLAGARYAAMPG